MKQRIKKSERVVSKLMKEFKKIRKERGFSHEKVASLTGLHRTTIGLLESEKRVPTILTCLKISSALEVQLYDLLKKVSNSN